MISALTAAKGANLISNQIILHFIPVPFFLGLAALALLLIALRLFKRSPAYLFVFALFWLYLLLVASVTIFPIPIPLDTPEVTAAQRVQWTLSRVNLTPFFAEGFNRSRPVIREMIANVLLTIPLGFSVRYLVRLEAIHIPFLASGAGLFIEGLQLAISLAVGMPYRTVDINDLLLNAAGVLIGYGLFRIFSWVFLVATRFFGVPRKGLLGIIYAAARQG